MKAATGLNRRGHRRPRRPRLAAPSQYAVSEPSRGPELNVARALLELTSSIHGDWSAAIRRTVQFEAEILHVERVSFWSFHEEHTLLRCDQGYVAGSRLFETGATLYRADDPVYFDAVLEARILVITDVSTDPRAAGLRAYCEARGIGAMLDVPVWAEGRLAGLICHEHVGSERRWTPSDKDFAMAAAQVVSSTLAARARTEAEAVARRAAFLNRVSRTVLPCLDSHEIGARAAALLVPKIADIARVFILNRQGVLERLASSCQPWLSKTLAEVDRDVAAKAEPARFAEQAVRQGQALLVPEITDPLLERHGVGGSVRAMFTKFGVRTGLAVPMQHARSTLGAITLFATDRHYGPEDVSLAREVADSVAAALENARLYELAREAIRARDDFVVLASHELRTPLASLQLILDRRLRGKNGRESESRESLKQDQAMARQVRRLTGLVERMLDAIRIQSEGISLSREACNLADIVERAVEGVRERAQRTDGSPIAAHLERGLVGMWDRAWLGKAVDALLDNAVKFGPQEPVDVVLRRDGPEALLTVRDGGDGIPPDRISSIFSPFERAVSKENYGGLGLGLFVAKAVVDAHRGSIHVTSRFGEGSTFVVYLPLGPPPG